jgi:hypothetical protein
MNRRNVFLMVGLSLLLAGCGEKSATNRFRVIATVEVDGQKVEGSTVMEITYDKVEHSLIGMGGATVLKGEALVLDLKGRGTVYVLPYAHDLSSGSLGQVYEFGVLSSLGVEHSVGTLSSEDFARVRQARGRMPFRLGNPTRLPAFVAFRDEKIPRTIYELDPKNLGRSFPGVRFVGLDLEFTDARVTNVLTQRLPWLEDPIAKEHFDRDPPGQIRAAKDRPIGFKITPDHFFGLGSLQLRSGRLVKTY